jgi:predicted transcriptional regulator
VPPATKIRLDAEMQRRLQRLADVRDMPSDQLLDEAIRQYVEREERREQLRRDALDAWTEFRSTGLHVTAEEADAWLARLEVGEDAEPPVPHD